MTAIVSSLAQEAKNPAGTNRTCFKRRIKEDKHSHSTPITADKVHA